MKNFLDIGALPEKAAEMAEAFREASKHLPVIDADARITMHRVTFGTMIVRRSAPAPELTPRQAVEIRLRIDEVRLMHTAMLLGAPITREHAHQQAWTALSDADKALLADDVTPAAP